MANRIDKILGIFGLSATTIIPVTPVTGVAYRDPAIAAAIAEGAWPFNTIVDSKNFNQIMYNYSGTLYSLDRRGVLAYSTVVDYDDLPGVAWGSDGVLYVAYIANGPATTVVDPVGDMTGTWLPLLQVATEATPGILEVATQAEMLAGALDDKIGTPLKVTKLFDDAGRHDLVAKGYQKLPGGLIIQWGTKATAGSGVHAETFGIAFPTACLSITTTPDATQAGPTATSTIIALTAAGFNIDSRLGVAANFRWIAIGH